MNVIYCKELNKYFEDIKTASICTSFTTNYIKCCITGRYKNPFYYHFYSVPLNNKMLLTTFDSVKNSCDVNKELEKINDRYKVYYKNESESKIDLSTDKPKEKKEKLIYVKKLDKYMTVSEIKAYCKNNLEQLKKENKLN